MYSLNKDYDKIYLGDKQLLTGNIYLGDTLINTLNNERSVFKKWLYDVGDVIVYDKTRRTKHAIDPNRLPEISPDDYEAIGVVAIPSSHDVYGTKEAGVIALKFNSVYTPDEGGPMEYNYYNYQYRQYGDGITLKGLGDTTNNPTDTLNATGLVGYIPTDHSKGITSPDGLNYDSSLPNSNSDNIYLPSPYNSKGAKNELYKKAVISFNGTEESKTFLPPEDYYNNWKTVQGTPEIQEQSHIEMINTPDTVNIIKSKSSSITGTWYLKTSSNTISQVTFIPKSYEHGLASRKLCVQGQPGDKIVITGTHDEDTSLMASNLDQDSYNLYFGTEDNPSVVLELPDANEHYFYIVSSRRIPYDWDPNNITSSIYISKDPTPHKVIDVSYKPARPAFDDNQNTPIPFVCSWRFHTKGTQQGDWYVPSVGELGYIICKLTTINFSLQAVQTWNDAYNIQLFQDIYLMASSTATPEYRSQPGGFSYCSYMANSSTGMIQSVARNNNVASIPFTRIKPNEFN